MVLVLVPWSLEFVDEHLVRLGQFRELDSRLVEGRVLQEERQRVRRRSEMAEEPWSTKEQQSCGCRDSEATTLSFRMEESRVNPCQREEMREIA